MMRGTLICEWIEMSINPSRMCALHIYLSIFMYTEWQYIDYAESQTEAADA